jgi:pimeloyl-ACP methyl ester carboxylesterase
LVSLRTRWAWISDPYEHAMARGPHGLVDDYRAVRHPDWGFDPSAVTVPACLWQGDADDAVSPKIGHRLAALVRGAELQLVPDAGHFLVLEHGTAIFERLLGDR